MNKEEWKERIKTSCSEAGTYKPFFEQIIETLASILERRDATEEAFQRMGGNKHTLVLHTNKAGAQNLEQNPALRLINDLNRDALAYWRDLGLTPAGYKKLTANVVEDQTAQGFEKLLERIGT